MAIETATVSSEGQFTTPRQWIGTIVVSVQGLKDGVVLLERSRDNVTFYTTDLITEDLEANAFAPGNTLQDYYRLRLIKKNFSGDVELAVGN